MEDLADALRRLPKVELHVHLEGGFAPGRIAELADAAGEELPDEPERLLTTESLPALLARLDWWCGLVRAPEQAERQAYDFAALLAEDGVAYAEVIVNPTHWSGLRRPVLLEAVSAGFTRAEADGLADCWLLPSLLRRQSEEEAVAFVRELERRPPERLVGLSIDGNEAETGPTGRRFAAAYALAGALGLGRTAHAGESSGPEGVLSALDDLGVSRIDHGIRGAEDPLVLTRLVEDQVTLNVALSSNLTLLDADIHRHPIRRLIDAGVPVTINTDDPVTLGVSLSGELALASGHLGWGFDDVVAATERAVAASFAGPGRAATLRTALAQ